MSCDHEGTFALIVMACEATPAPTLHQVAARLRVHRHTITMIVIQETGLTWRSWRQGIIARRAQDMLIREPVMSIKEVAATFGLTTNGLRRLLVREYGRSSAEIRRRGRRRGS